jgi:predicted alpha/beta-hydrolase family hydrolase
MVEGRMPAEELIPSGRVMLRGALEPAGDGSAVVLFAHGSGSSRHSPRNRAVAQAIRDAGIGTLLFDLLTEEEAQEDRVTGRLRYDLQLLAERLIDATAWTLSRVGRDANIGYFGASTGAAAALLAAAELGDRIGAVVSRGGRPDLARHALDRVAAATLLIVGERDSPVIVVNQRAAAHLRCDHDMVLVPAAGHLFEEPRQLAEVADHAVRWFRRYLLGHVDLPPPADRRHAPRP